MLKLTNDQIVTLHKLAAEKMNVRGNIRRGQAYSNALSDMGILHPHLEEISSRIHGTDADPFYKDENLDRFFEEIC